MKVLRGNKSILPGSEDEYLAQVEGRSVSPSSSPSSEELKSWYLVNFPSLNLIYLDKYVDLVTSSTFGDFELDPIPYFLRCVPHVPNYKKVHVSRSRYFQSVAFLYFSFLGCSKSTEVEFICSKLKSIVISSARCLPLCERSKFVPHINTLYYNITGSNLFCC